MVNEISRKLPAGLHWSEAQRRAHQIRTRSLDKLLMEVKFLGAVFQFDFKFSDVVSKGFSCLLLFGRNRAFSFERGVHRVPGKARAFDARGKVAHPGENRQTAQMVRRRFLIQFARHHPVKLVKERFRFLFALALDALRHHAGGGLRDGATGALEADIFDNFVFQLQIDRQLVAAERVIALGGAVGRFKPPKVTRLLVMIQNDLLVKLAQFRHFS
jgi:hypothetical protein